MVSNELFPPQFFTDLAHAYGEIALEIIQRDDSLVPVRSGELKRSYGYVVNDDVVTFTNDEPYAPFFNDKVEETLLLADAEIEERLATWTADWIKRNA